MERTDILDLLRYNRWANGQILEQMQQLTLAQLMAPANLDHGSAFQTLQHALDVEWSWRLMAQQIPAPKLFAEVEDLSTLAAITEYWEREASELQIFVQGFGRTEVKFTGRLWHTTRLASTARQSMANIGPYCRPQHATSH